MTGFLVAALMLFLGAAIGGVLTAAVYERRTEAGEDGPVERGGRPEVKAFRPTSPWAAPHDEDGVS